eukprot:TRINITY_DN7752_c0_g2_i1.p1 TRINITY_DN7752_c0_g2~~TRINITY_DN7752_c0_g2_i1.p1  ORF type:complete len:476 (+),score=60.81 TRINITY_DN7752_c0_g2_i1:84-1511(+)
MTDFKNDIKLERTTDGESMRLLLRPPPAYNESENAAETENDHDEITVTKAPQERIGIDLDKTEDGALLLSRVAWGSAAKRCGVKRFIGWRLTHINSFPITSMNDVRKQGKGVEEAVLRFEAMKMDTPRSSSDEGSMIDPEHPFIVDDSTDDTPKKDRPTKPKGGDSISTKYSTYIYFLLGPVSVTMMLVVYSVVVFDQINDGTDTTGKRSSSVLPINNDPTHSDSNAERFGGALLNALVITGAITVITVIFVALYKYNCMKIMAGWLLVSTTMVLCGVGGLWVERFAVRYQAPLDWITYSMLMWNYSVVGLICIYYRGHPSLTRAYHITSSAVLAWFMTRLPEWTTWCLLATVALYDIFAVCCGPLKVLVEESVAQQRPIPALVYESRRYKLGLGDFIFYSLLVGRAAVFGYIPWVSSFVGVLTGLCLTLFALATLKRPLPALPSSIFLGIIFAFTSRYILEPYAVEYAVRGLAI